LSDFICSSFGLPGLISATQRRPIRLFQYVDNVLDGLRVHRFLRLAEQQFIKNK